MIDLEVEGRRERIRPGLHICQFYNHDREVSEAAAPLLRDGLRAHDKGVVSAAPPRLDEIRTLLRAGGIDVDAAARSGQLVLSSDRAALLSNGRFDPYHLLARHQALIARSVAERWNLVRCVIDMSWLTQRIATPEQLLKYEAAADAIFTFQNRPIVALLQYNSSELPEELRIELLKIHPIAVVGKFIRRNPYYINAEEYMVKIIRLGQQRRAPRAAV
jgi:hypothetical protein